MSTETDSSTVWLVDGHAHYYSCYEPSLFLDASAANFARCAGEVGLPNRTLGCLLLASTTAAGSHLRTLEHAASVAPAHGWSFQSTDERNSLLACDVLGRRLLLIGGSQFVTREGLEVLAFGGGEEFPAGLSLTQALQAAVSSGALAVIPWGFGKWWFRRGRLVATALRSFEPGEIFLGDSGGRPQPGPRPRQFSLAAQADITVLQGSDPLPLPQEVDRAGSYGFVLQGHFDLAKPAASLTAALRDNPGPQRPFGKRRSPISFLMAQLALRAGRSRG